MSKKVKSIIITLLCLVIVVSVGVACSNKEESVKATISAPEYLLGKVGEEISLDNVNALDENGNKQAIIIKVEDESGKDVLIDNAKFTVTKAGKYKVTVSGGKNVTAETVTFFVYVTADGSAYTLVAPENMPITAEWGTECVLPLAKAVHVSGDEKIADIKVYDKKGAEVDVNADRFVPMELGFYTVKYIYGGGEYKAQIECIDTSAPIVVLRNNAIIKPAYDADFLLPKVGVLDAQEDTSKRVIKLYSEDTEREIKITDGRAKIDASKYFTYFIHVEDVNGYAEDYEFIITRAYDGYIDSFDLEISGKTVSWTDRSYLESLDGYRTVSGYKVSLDGGETFIKTLSRNETEYTLTSKEFCEIVVVELSDKNDRESAVSSTLLFDGTLKSNTLADFNNEKYLGTVSCGSYSGFDWNYEYALTTKYSESGFADDNGLKADSGTLLLYNLNNVQVKITFPKRSDVLLDDSVLVMRMFGDNDWMYVNKYGKASIGEDLQTYGYKKGEWCNVRIPISKLDKQAGDYLEGIELSFIGAVAIDNIKLLSLSENLEGEQVANFDMEEYSAMLAVTSNFQFNSTYHMDYEIVTNGVNGIDSGALKIVNKGSVVALQITFPKKVVVDEQSYLLLDILEEQNSNTSWTTRIVKHDAEGDDSTGKYSTGYALSDFGHEKGKWNTVKIPIVEGLGIPVGETINGIQLVLQDIENTPLTIYVDEIRVESMAQTIQDMKDNLKDGEVANYNDENYSMFLETTGSDTSYEIKDGILTVNATVWAWQTLKFLESKTVSNGDYIVIRLQGNSRMMVALDNNSTGAIELLHGDPVANDCLPYSKDFQTAFIPIEKFGLKANDTIDRICLGWWDNAGANGTFKVDYVGYITTNDYADGIVADYTSEVGEILASGKHEFVGAMLDGSPWYYGTAQEVKFDSELNATVISSTSEEADYRAIRLMLAKPVKVTENTVITMELCYMPKTENDWLYLSDYRKDKGPTEEINMFTGSNFIKTLSKTGEFETVSFKATAFFNVGDTINYLDIAMREGDLAVKTISVEEISLEFKTLVMGDSYTSPTYWKTLGSDLLEINGYTIGVGGTTVPYWEERLDEVVSHNPNYLVMHLGVNDINQGVSGETCATNLIRLINAIKLRLPNTKIYYITISNNRNYQVKWEEYAKCNKKMIEYAYITENVSIIDFASKQVENDNVWANGGYIENDATHLTAEAYEVLSQMVIDAVNGLLPEVKPENPPVTDEAWNDKNDFGKDDPYVN